jgi:hypothetical protein
MLESEFGVPDTGIGVKKPPCHSSLGAKSNAGSKCFLIDLGNIRSTKVESDWIVLAQYVFTGPGGIGISAEGPMIEATVASFAPKRPDENNCQNSSF